MFALEVLDMNRNILCIDLKSFFASVECVERGLDPFKTPLVVVNTKQGFGAMTLAVTPYLKEKGVPGRIRLYEIKKDIFYYKVPPRMSLYVKKSKEVVDIYLDFVSSDDLHIYSIDECFLDVTDYLHYYQMTDEELAKKIMDTIFLKTHLTATCGIGPNMLLAKVAMDKEAKKNKDGISKWTYDDVKKKLWQIKPLSDVWGIGKRLEKRLNNLGIYSVEDLALANKDMLKKKFGILGTELWWHANGIDNCVIKDLKHEVKNHFISHSQVLLKDYYDDDVLLIIREMLSVLGKRLRKENLECGCIYLGITYSKIIGGGFYHSLKIDMPTQDEDIFFNICKNLYDRYYIVHNPIRKVSISFSKLSVKGKMQLNLFQSYEDKVKDENLNLVIDTLHKRFGNNSVLKATFLLPLSTIKERNKQS